MKLITNHLPEVIKNFPQDLGPKCFSDEALELREKLLHRKKWFFDAVAFNLGGCKEILNIDPVRELAILPFDVCWFEFTQKFFVDGSEENMLWGMLVKKEDQRRHEALFFVEVHQNWFLYCWVRFAIGENILWSCGDKYDPLRVNQKNKKLFFHLFYSALSAINCVNVQLKENKPNAKQIKKAEKRFLPIFSTWTLHIKKTAINQTSQESFLDRNSPRVHLRRGHFRQYKPGQYIWVQPTVVGNGDGMILKDYKI